MSHQNASTSRSPARQARRGRLVSALAVSLALLVAGCGGGSDAGQGSGNATVRLPADLGPDQHFDPVEASSPNAFSLMAPVYGTLLRQSDSGELEPDLAKSVTVVDDKTIKVELQPGQKFSDGTPFDAEAIKYGLERTIAAKNTKSNRVEINSIGSIDIASPTSLTIKLSKPIAGKFMTLLAHGESFIVPKSAVDAGVDLSLKPTGAGPFKVESLTKEQKYVLVKNENYVHADRVKVQRVEYVHVKPGDPQALGNALTSRAVDAVGGILRVSADNMKAFAAAGFETRSEPSAAHWAMLAICKTKLPFDDVRVRQALNYAIDREVLVERGAQGKGQPAYGWYPKGHENHDSKYDTFYAHNPQKAKELLAAAGASNLSFTLAVSPGIERQAEVLQSQWGEAGIKVELTVPSNLIQEFFIEHRQPVGAFLSSRDGLDRVSRTLIPGSVGNVCDYDNPELNRLVTEAAAAQPGSPELIQAWHQIEQITIEEALNVLLHFGTHDAAWNKDRIAKISFSPDSLGNLNIDPSEVELK